MKNTNREYKVIGIMSGTSLDGVDLAYCHFKYQNGIWDHAIIIAKTYPYPKEWKERLKTLPDQKAHVLRQTDIHYGKFLGQLVKKFMEDLKCNPDFIASHGHTVFHRPDEHLTLQIGNGAFIAATTNLPVVCDFRTTDIALGGQGAPLVPIGDKMLFPEYDYCLNLGGFANISYDHSGQRVAFDICPCNIVLNKYSELLGKPFDEYGQIARTHNIEMKLFDELNSLDYYRRQPPKSLGFEWVSKQLFPLLNKSSQKPGDILRTFTEHIAYQINVVIENKKKGKMLVTGGGAYNSYLVEKIKDISEHQIIVPDEITIQYKEALIFAFLGVLRMQNEINILKSVTGAIKDHTGGCIYSINKPAV
ncbi:MAG: anhydro-N-acetylmuramic acid kinase [Bacteroidetes bacterium]|nr:anhydro-N-acetylmuramic acid kinase [Bacteroidota bacterium]